MIDDTKLRKGAERLAPTSALQCWCELHGFCVKDLRLLISVSQYTAVSLARPPSAEGRVRFALHLKSIQELTSEFARELFESEDFCVNSLEKSISVFHVPSHLRSRSSTRFHAYSKRGARCTINLGSRAKGIDYVHEYSHCIQYIRCNTASIAPIYRETCAFLGELLFLRFLMLKTPKKCLFHLRDWYAGNGYYLNDGVRDLVYAFKTQSARYSYSWNYPIARCLALVIVDECNESEVIELFSDVTKLSLAVSKAMLSLRRRPLRTAIPPIADFGVSTDSKLNFSSTEELGALLVEDAYHNQSSFTDSLTIGDQYKLATSEQTTKRKSVGLDFLCRPSSFSFVVKRTERVNENGHAT